MRVALETRVLQAQGGGVRRYVQSLRDGLVSREELDLQVIMSRPKHQILIGQWLNGQVQNELAQMRPDVVHFTKADVPKIKNFRTVVTIYDVIPLLYPESQKLLQRMYWPKALKRAAHNSDAIITISEASKRDIVRLLEVDEKKVYVTKLASPEISNNSSSTASVLAKKRRASSYILYVGTIEPRKNVPLLIRAYARIANQIDEDLLIVGKHYKGVSAVEEEIKKAGLEGRVKLLDFVSDKKLRQLYADASLFVWPSIYEGWGFPPQEAMMSGVPVIVSDGGSLPEVVGEVGRIVKFSVSEVRLRTSDLKFEKDLSDEMLLVLENKTLQNELSEMGKSWANKRSWEDVVNETIAVYEKIRQ